MSTLYLCPRCGAIYPVGSGHLTNLGTPLPARICEKCLANDTRPIFQVSTKNEW